MRVCVSRSGCVCGCVYGCWHLCVRLFSFLIISPWDEPVNIICQSLRTNSKDLLCTRRAGRVWHAQRRRAICMRHLRSVIVQHGLPNKISSQLVPHACPLSIHARIIRDRRGPRTGCSRCAKKALVAHNKLSERAANLQRAVDGQEAAAWPHTRTARHTLPQPSHGATPTTVGSTAASDRIHSIWLRRG